VCCGGGWGDQTRIRDREEHVIYDICTPTPQDEASYDTKVKKGQVPSRGQRRRRC